MNKILFASDFYSYQEKGDSITGIEYQKKKWGPTPVNMWRILKDLRERGDISIEELDVFDKTEKRPIPHREPNYDILTAKEVALVDSWIDRLEKFTATQVSNWSHKFLGWKLVDYGDTIPYNSVYWGSTKKEDITEQDIKDAKRIHEKYGNKPIPRPLI